MARSYNYGANGDWLATDFSDDSEVIWLAITKGYSIDKMLDISNDRAKYALLRGGGGGEGGSNKKLVGVFDSTQELVAMLKLVMASDTD